MKKTTLCLASMWAAACVWAAPEPVSFDVLEYVIEGNTVLPPDLVERTVSPYMGPGKTLKDVELAREALEKAYQDAGYLSVVVALPNQQLRGDGEVRLEVIEARIDKLTVSGAAYHRPQLIKDQVTSLQPGSVPYFPQVQTQLAGVQTGHLQITPLLTGGDEPDKINMDLKVQDNLPLVGSIELNNRQSYNTSRGRLSAVASYGNLFQLGHRLGVSWQYAPWRPADSNTLTLIYGLPLSPVDDLSFSATKSDSDTPVRVGDGGNTLTRGEFYGLRWQRTLPARQWPVQHNISAALDNKLSDDETVLVDTLGTKKPALRYTTVTLGYGLTWLPSEGESLTVSTTANMSNSALAGRRVDCDGRANTEQFECKRYGARPDYLAWRLSMDYTTPIWGGWRLNASVDAQAASGPLVSGEQYSLGGDDTVRGYYDYEQAGDGGWNTRLELVTPPWSFMDSWQMTGLVFGDRGSVSLQEPLEGQVSHANLGSAGLGLRIKGVKGFQLAMDAALPIFETQRAEQDGLQTTTKRQWRVHVRASQSF